MTPVGKTMVPSTTLTFSRGLRPRVERARVRDYSVLFVCNENI